MATASVADLHDLEAKVAKAMDIEGARYIHIHVPCPLGWKSDPAFTVKVARLAVESGLYPLFEAEHGEITNVAEIRRQVPVADYLKLQRRFAHVLKNQHQLERIQAIADANIRKFGLVKAQGD